MHHLRGIFRELRDHMPGEMRHAMRHMGKHHTGKHRRGRGFGHFFGGDMGDAGFDRSGFRTGRKLASDDLQLLLLALIAEKPSHGYDLIKVLEERSGGYYVPSPGMIYPALTYLEEAGQATIEPEGTKKLYRISEEGRRHLEQNRTAADDLIAQLERIGRRMGDVRRAFAGDGDEAGEEGDTNELRQARRELRRVLRERKRGTPEESRRIAEILRRAAADILGKA
jgi:DNA-binding PadR family transcriptional regulator